MHFLHARLLSPQSDISSRETHCTSKHFRAARIRRRLILHIYIHSLCSYGAAHFLSFNFASHGRQRRFRRLPAFRIYSFINLSSRSVVFGSVFPPTAWVLRASAEPFDRWTSRQKSKRVGTKTKDWVVGTCMFMREHVGWVFFFVRWSGSCGVLGFSLFE